MSNGNSRSSGHANKYVTVPSDMPEDKVLQFAMRVSVLFGLRYVVAIVLLSSILLYCAWNSSQYQYNPTKYMAVMVIITIAVDVIIALRGVIKTVVFFNQVIEEARKHREKLQQSVAEPVSQSDAKTNSPIKKRRPGDNQGSSSGPRAAARQLDPNCLVATMPPICSKQRS